MDGWIVGIDSPSTRNQKNDNTARWVRRSTTTERFDRRIPKHADPCGVPRWVIGWVAAGSFSRRRHRRRPPPPPNGDPPRGSGWRRGCPRRSIPPPSFVRAKRSIHPSIHPAERFPRIHPLVFFFFRPPETEPVAMFSSSLSFRGFRQARRSNATVPPPGFFRRKAVKRIGPDSLETPYNVNFLEWCCNLHLYNLHFLLVAAVQYNILYSMMVLYTVCSKDFCMSIVGSAPLGSAQFSSAGPPGKDPEQRGRPRSGAR